MSIYESWMDNVYKDYRQPMKVKANELEDSEAYKVHQMVCADLSLTYAQKNHDYGNAFVKVREEYPNAILIRLTDKLERLKALMREDGEIEPMVKDESILDTLEDIANYCIMELIERQGLMGDIDDGSD